MFMPSKLGISPLLAKLLSSQESSLQSKKHITKSKGISPLLASVLLIATTVVISTMFAGWLASTTSITQATITNKTNEGVACAAAEITIDDSYITNGSTSETASVILRNSGGTDDLTITSAQLYNKNGDNITASNVPISNFDRGSTSTLSFSFKPAGDSSKYGNNGTLMNGPLLTAGRYGSALSFDGVNDYVDVGSAAYFSQVPLTYGLWFNPSANKLASLLHRTSLVYFYQNGLAIDMYFTSTGSPDVSVANLITLNSWQHVAYTIDQNNNSVLYFNGVRVGNGTSQSPGTTGNFYIGNTTGNPSRMFNGIIDDAAIWNRSLTNAEINTSMNQGPLLVSNTNDLVGYWNFDGGIITCPNDFSRVVVTTNCGGVSAEFSKPPKCR